MKRLARILLHLVTILSLVLFFATIVFWVRSRGEPDQLRFGRAGGRYWQFNSRPGLLACSTADGWAREQRLEWSITHGLGVPFPPRGGPTFRMQRFAGWEMLDWSSNEYRDFGVLSIETGVCTPLRFIHPTAGPLVYGTWGPSAAAMLYTTVVLPFWFLAIVTVALPMGRLAGAAMRRLVREARAARGVYPAWDGDVRVLPEPLLRRVVSGEIGTGHMAIAPQAHRTGSSDAPVASGDYSAETCKSSRAAADVLPYGPPPRRRLAPGRRDLAGAFFIMMSIVAGLLGFLSLAGLVITMIGFEPPNDEPESGAVATVLIFLATGVVSIVLSLLAARSAKRRLAGWG